jgi:hypothetical protein
VQDDCAEGPEDCGTDGEVPEAAGPDEHAANETTPTTERLEPNRAIRVVSIMVGEGVWVPNIDATKTTLLSPGSSHSSRRRGDSPALATLNVNLEAAFNAHAFIPFRCIMTMLARTRTIEGLGVALEVSALPGDASAF